MLSSTLAQPPDNTPAASCLAVESLLPLSVSSRRRDKAIGYVAGCGYGSFARGCGSKQLGGSR